MTAHRLRKTWRLPQPLPRRPLPIVVLALAAISTFSIAAMGGVEPSNVCEREMARASRKYEVPLAVLYAVGLTETGQRGSLHPYALNLEGPAVFASSLPDAMRHFEIAQRSGVKLIDVGCMQINQHYHGSQFQSVEEMFDPHKNVDYAARFLKDLRQKEGSWTLAAARYHAGPNNNPEQKRYVCAVISNMVATGFGAWTPTARSFCR